LRTLAPSLLSLLLAAPAFAGEGKWTPQQVLAQGPEWVKAQGFGLPLERMWDEKAGGGLLANAVQLPGCSGSFVSAEGLLITNHHCADGILQEHSTPQANLSLQGYLARTRADEKKAGAFRIQVPRAFRDVTNDVLAAVPAGAGDRARFQAVEAKQKALVAECESRPDTRCQFAAFDGGLFFTLTEFEEIEDVRLVYAPPLGVGNYGGEVDNWSWPRHTGDFSLLRAYKDGQPYRPRYFFPVSTEGVREGDAVAVLGYPGRSYRSWIADEMREREERWFPAVRDLYAEWIGILDEEGARSAEAAIAVIDDRRGYENSRKNAEGQVAGLRRGRIVEKQRAADERVKTWAASRTEGRAALEAYEGLAKRNEASLRTWDRDFLLDMLSRGSRALRWAVQLARRATEGVKPDAEREPGYMERDLPRMRDQLERDQKRYSEATDRRLCRSWVKRALTLPVGQRIRAVDEAFGSTGGRRGAGMAPRLEGRSDEDALEAHIERLWRASRVFDLAARLAMFDETPEALKARKDPLLDLGLALDAERMALKERRDAEAGVILRLRPAWRKAVVAAAGRPVAPDANGSLRVTFGRVKGYSPREAVTMAPQTTLAGAVEKHTGEDPFDLPAPVREAFAAKRVGRWADPRLGEVPIGLLSDCDTTGGNSGSPTIDGEGRLVGVNFDRVWENVANDFGYNPDVARNVSVDVRYLLWNLDVVEGAGAVLRELGVASE
jgi:Peptidase S46